MLYNSGIDNTSITGGWEQLFNTANISDYYGTYGPFEMLTRQMNAHVLNHPINSSRSLLSIYTKNKINLSNFQTAHLIFSGSPGDANAYFTCNIDTVNNVDIFPTYFKRRITNDEKFYDTSLYIVSVDISSINNSCYIGVLVGSTTVEPQTSTWFGIRKIYLE